VTNAEFLAFVEQHKLWRRGRVARVFADDGYLAHWAGPVELGPEARPDQPVTRVSWFAATAYCSAQGKRLPTESEWELAAAAGEKSPDGTTEPGLRERILAWYSEPTPARLPAVGRGRPNYWGIVDLHQLVWEWVLDYNSTLVSSDSRTGKSTDRLQFCGAGALAAGDKQDYASFMRLAFRSSLEARYTARALGFRCARDAQHHHEAMGAAEPRGDSIYALSAMLVDQNGEPVGLDVFRGHPVLISMFYGTCRDACPLLITDLHRIESELPPAIRSDLRIVLVSFDPDRDTPEALRALAQAHDADASRWRFLRAPGDTVREVAAVLGIRYRRLSDGSFNHSSVITLLDRSGVVLTRIEGIGQPHRDLLERLEGARP
jgi:cytochrome oxidase Cu insertion factor (SCO1/SenC/PrrC family)